MTNIIFFKNKRLVISCFAKRDEGSDSTSKDSGTNVIGSDQQQLVQKPERPSSDSPMKVVPKTVDLSKLLDSKVIQIEKPLTPEQIKFARSLIVHRDKDGNESSLFNLLTSESELKDLLSTYIAYLNSNQEQLSSEVQLQALIATMKSYSRIRNNVNQYLSVLESCLTNRFNRVRQERGRKATGKSDTQFEIGATLTKVDGTRRIWNGTEWVEPIN